MAGFTTTLSVLAGFTTTLSVLAGFAAALGVLAGFTGTFTGAAGVAFGSGMGSFFASPGNCTGVVGSASSPPGTSTGRSTRGCTRSSPGIWSSTACVAGATPQMPANRSDAEDTGWFSICVGASPEFKRSMTVGAGSSDLGVAVSSGGRSMRRSLRSTGSFFLPLSSSRPTSSLVLPVMSITWAPTGIDTFASLLCEARRSTLEGTYLTGSGGLLSSGCMLRGGERERCGLYMRTGWGASSVDDEKSVSESFTESLVESLAESLTESLTESLAESSLDSSLEGVMVSVSPSPRDSAPEPSIAPSIESTTELSTEP